ncbi:hypothetical protein [Romboutsia sp.]|uniref:hypothetical protein n=1 Tax=Romboutsia sp. TaxID=1965302 RepID=UPI003F37A93B
MILKSLEDLEKYKNSMSISKPLVSLKDINEVSEGGGESTNTCSNKLFYWNFEPYYIEDLVRCYEKLTIGNINAARLHELEIDLKTISEEMISENTCPIEAILYSSKIVNNLLINNNSLIETLGNVIAHIYCRNEFEYKDTVKFILEEWSWPTQVMILINACGKIGDVELFKIVYDRHTKGDTRLQALKAFMSINNETCIDYTLKIISLTAESDNTEVQMAKYFIHNYTKSFGNEAIKNAKDYLNAPTINKQARKIISRVIPSASETEVITLDIMIKKAKNWEVEYDFEEIFKKWMNNNTTRKNAFLAIRYSNSPRVEELIISIVDKYNCNSIEIGTALITLAQWGSRRGCSKDFENLIKEHKSDITKKVYCNAAMCSLGREEDAIELVKEFLEENYYDSRQIFSMIRDCAYKSNQLLRYAVQIVYDEYLNSSDDRKVIKAINGAYELCDKPKFNFKDIALPSIKRAIGLNENISKEYSEEVYAAVINLVERLLNDKNKDEFIDILFFIIENEACNQRLKFKAISMLKRLRVDPPK